MNEKRNLLFIKVGVNFKLDSKSLPCLLVKGKYNNPFAIASHTALTRLFNLFGSWRWLCFLANEGAV